MASQRSHILVADDQLDVLQALRLLLKSEGFTCHTASSPGEALEALKRGAFDAALIDLNYSRDTTSGQEGLDLIEKLRAIEENLPVVVMTAWATIDIAVEAMRRGAGDFIEKPWENRRLISVLRNQVALGHARRREDRLSTENALLRGEGEGDFVACSAAMQPVLAMVERVAPSEVNVLILGENGTGKGVIAGLIHRASRRAGQPLIKVNMGGIAETVFESEMFGHVKGAFTDAKSDRIGRFELADGGTLFLDEIANIPMTQQPKLLRVLEDGELERVGSSRTLKVDVRLLSATNADLATEVARGAFRKDLLYRLNTVEIRLPPLRKRREDIAPMAEAFLRHSGRRYKRDDLRFSPSVLRLLEQYAWPGNVRELSHVVERAVLMTQGDVIDQIDVHAQGGHAPAVIQGDGPGTLASMTLEEAEQAMIRNALDRCDSNIQRAADILGLSRPALYRRLEKYGIQVT